MTAQRLVRGSKARVLLSVCGILFCVGVIVLLQNTQKQLETAKKNYDTCIMQQESLSTQLQVIVDYKSKLEKSLQTEKAEHKQTRTELEARVNDEKSRRDKTSMEANLRFTSLQQHYKLLQTKHDDLKEKSDKLQTQYLEETDKLQAKVRELQEQLKAIQKNKDTALEHLKSQYLQLQVDKERLQEQLKKSESSHNDMESQMNHLTKENHQLQRKVEELKSGKPHPETASSPAQEYPQYVQSGNNFQKQVESSAGVYQMNFEEKSSSKAPTVENQQQLPNQQSAMAKSQNEETLPSPNEVGDGKPETDDAYANAQKQENADTNLPKPGDTNFGDFYGGDLDMHKHRPVLENPKHNMSKSSSTHSSTKTNLLNGNVVQPLAQPKVTPSTKKIAEINADNVLRPPDDDKIKVPAGVVPVQQEQKVEPKTDAKTEDKQIPDDINLALPNRYRNNIIESELAKEQIKETKVDKVKPLEPADIPDENGAGEVMNEVDNHDEVKDNNINDMLKKPIMPPDNRKKQHIDNLKLGDKAVAYDGADYDKDDQKEDDGVEMEEDDDIDEYDLAAKQKDPAIRN